MSHYFELLFTLGLAPSLVLTDSFPPFVASLPPNGPEMTAENSYLRLLGDRCRGRKYCETVNAANLSRMGSRCEIDEAKGLIGRVLDFWVPIVFHIPLVHPDLRLTPGLNLVAN